MYVCVDTFVFCFAAQIGEWCGAAGIRFNGEPERASRPFDEDRDGFVLAGKVRC